jgi:hypothetical protein
MSHQATTWVLERSEQEGIEFIVLFVIANHCHPDGTGAFPSILTIAGQARVCERRARYAVAALEKCAELQVQRQKGGMPNEEWKSRNYYTIPGVVRDGFYTERKPKPAAPYASGIDIPSGTASGIPSGTAMPPNNPLELTTEQEEHSATFTECPKCGNPEPEGHKCPGHLSQKQKEKKWGTGRPKPRPSSKPYPSRNTAPAPRAPMVSFDEMRRKEDEEYEQRLRRIILGTP